MADGGAEREEEVEEEVAEEQGAYHLAGSRSRSQESHQEEVDICPITDRHEKPFRLMDLPAEIRIEIYRACLTRPFDVLLSRENKPAEAEKQREEESRVAGEVDDNAVDGDHESAVMSRLLPRTSVPLSEAASEQQQDTTRATNASGVNAWSTRGMRALRSFTRNNLQRNGNGNSNNNTANPAANTNNDTPTATSSNRNSTINTNVHNNFPPRATNRRTVTFTSTYTPPSATRTPRPQDADPLHVNLLRTSKLIYKESRAILYGENNFLLDLDTAQSTLAALHQRSRGQIKRLRVTIPSHNFILERFSEVVRLSLRYCWRLRRFVIHTPFVLPGAEGSSTSGNTTVYANAFDILRWLPRQCEVVLEGNVCEEIRRVVEKNSNLAKSLDEVSHSFYTANGGRAFSLRREGGGGGDGGEETVNGRT